MVAQALKRQQKIQQCTYIFSCVVMQHTHNLSRFPHQPQYQPHVTFVTSYIFLSLTPAQLVVLIGHIISLRPWNFPTLLFFPQILILRLIFLFKALTSHLHHSFFLGEIYRKLTNSFTCFSITSSSIEIPQATNIVVLQ